MVIPRVQRPLAAAWPRYATAPGTEAEGCELGLRCSRDRSHIVDLDEVDRLLVVDFDEREALAGRQPDIHALPLTPERDESVGASPRSYISGG